MCVFVYVCWGWGGGGAKGERVFQTEIPLQLNLRAKHGITDLRTVSIPAAGPTPATPTPSRAQLLGNALATVSNVRSADIHTTAISAGN